MKKITSVALIGGGVIGAGWAARLLINGINVSICDPAPQVEARLGQVLENALGAYRKLSLAPVGIKGKLTFTDSLAEAVGGADFVQESGPERIDIKKALMAEICAHSDADVVVASSSSGLLPSEMQAGVRFPERIIVGHPFNPVYLIPLVEVVGGRQTSDDARRAAADFYRSIGMHPLQVRKEIDAFLADRLMEALWREALHLVNDGVATADEIDQAICYGPGLRWSFMGTFLVYRVAGGEGGFRHFMEQFGPSLKWPWTRFDGPDLSDEFLDRLAAQSDAQADGRSIRELEQLRDDCLVSVMQGLASHDYAAGKVLNRYQEKLYETHHPTVIDDTDDLNRPLRLHHDSVQPEWVDYNHHLTESRYLQAFGDASDGLFRYIGVDGDYHASGYSYYTVETHLNFFREAVVHQRFYITTQLLGGDDKRIHLFHTLHAADDDARLATTEQMLLHVNTAEGRACAAKPEVLKRLKPIIAAHANLPRPEAVGRAIRPCPARK